MNTFRSIVKAYFHLAALIFIVAAATLSAVTIYNFFAPALTINDGVILERLKLLAALSTIIPLIIMAVVGSFIGVFKLFGIKLADEKHEK